MKLRLCKKQTVETLRNSVGSNLEVYRTGTFSFLDEDSSCHMDIDIEFDSERLLSLNNSIKIKTEPGVTHEKVRSSEEVEHGEIVFNSLSGVKPYLARDERLWVYLTHASLLDYVRSRWPIPADDEAAKKHIRSHFFAKSARQIERDNAVSRLWWIAYLCSRSHSLPLKKALNIFTLRADVRAAIIERPTTAQSLRIFDAILMNLEKSYNHERVWFERDVFRAAMKELNRLGGVKLIEALPKHELEAIVFKAFEEASSR